MPSLGNVVVVAEQLLGKLGKGAPEIIDARAKAHLAEGELDVARFWQRVAKTMRHMLTFDPDYIAPGKGPRPIQLPLAIYRHVFAALPQASLLLQPNLVIVGANPAYLQATMTREKDIVGCDMFDVFPDNPSDKATTGTSNLGASFDRVLDNCCCDRMALQRYDIRGHNGLFEERWWEPINTPVLDEDGRIMLIMHQVEDVTAQLRGTPTPTPPATL